MSFKYFLKLCNSEEWSRNRETCSKLRTMADGINRVDDAELSNFQSFSICKSLKYGVNMI